MKWEDIKENNPTTFKRLVGVSRDMFEEMLLEAIRLVPPSTHKVEGKNEDQSQN